MSHALGNTESQAGGIIAALPGLPAAALALGYPRSSEMAITGL